MVRRIKVATVIGTRPEIIRLSRVVQRLDQCTDHVLIHTGQNYDRELNQIFFDDLRLRRPDLTLSCAGATSSQTIGNVVSRVDEALDEVRPDALLILGDTNSCMAAIPAKRRRIPVFHMEAGNRCFDHRVPEEINRRIVDHVADVNLTYSDIAREYLLREGLSPDLVIKTGSPMFEVLSYYRTDIDASGILSSLSLKDREFFVVSSHREENVDNRENFGRLQEILNWMAEEYQVPVIVSTHPRARRRFNDSDVQMHQLVTLLKPLGFFDYVHLQMHARATLSDSGTISEESSILGFPALNIREVHERPEAMEEAAVMMVGLSLSRVQDGLRVLGMQQAVSMQRPVADYTMPNVSDKVVRLIISYTDYVKRVVWKVH